MIHETWLQSFGDENGDRDHGSVITSVSGLCDAGGRFFINVT